MTALGAETGVYLESLLAPLAHWLDRPDVTDIYINRAQEVWVEELGGAISMHSCADLDEASLMRLARQIASRSSQGINREHPLLAAVLPGGARVQIVAPPATRGGMAFAVRKHIAASPTLDDYLESGSFNGLKSSSADDGRLAEMVVVDSAEGAATLRAAVLGRKNILISGGTSSGKTTFLNALLREIPAHERLILIEDTPELEMTHANSVGFVATRSAISEATVTAEDLLIAALRMRPDRIILGELRGSEAFTFLRSINTGHPGSMTTIHADTPARAVEQLALLVLQSGTQLRRADVVQYVRSSIDVFVQLERIGGRRQIVEIALRWSS
jgi:type IV secretion system protein VirB11